MIAAGVGQHPRRLLTQYAIDRALPARLQPELLEMYRQLSTLWQDWNQLYYNDNYIMKQGDEAEPAKPIKRLNSPSDPKRPAKRRKDLLTDLSKLNHPDIPDTSTVGPPEGFIFNAQYHIVICIACESMVQPGKSSIYQHLNRHGIIGTTCKAYMQHLLALKLRAFRELALPLQVIPAIKGLHLYSAFKCEICALFMIQRNIIFGHVHIHKLGVPPSRAWEMGRLKPSFQVGYPQNSESFCQCNQTASAESASMQHV